MVSMRSRFISYEMPPEKDLQMQLSGERFTQRLRQGFQGTSAALRPMSPNQASPQFIPAASLTRRPTSGLSPELGYRMYNATERARTALALAEERAAIAAAASRRGVATVAVATTNSPLERRSMSDLRPSSSLSRFVTGPIPSTLNEPLRPSSVAGMSWSTTSLSPPHGTTASSASSIEVQGPHPSASSCYNSINLQAEAGLQDRLSAPRPGERPPSGGEKSGFGQAQRLRQQPRQRLVAQVAQRRRQDAESVQGADVSCAPSVEDGLLNEHRKEALPPLGKRDVAIVGRSGPGGPVLLGHPLSHPTPQLQQMYQQQQLLKQQELQRQQELLEPKCSIDELTKVPESLFRALETRGHEARHRGQHILSRGSQPRGRKRLVRYDCYIARRSSNENQQAVPNAANGLPGVQRRKLPIDLPPPAATSVSAASTSTSTPIVEPQRRFNSPSRQSYRLSPMNFSMAANIMDRRPFAK